MSGDGDLLHQAAVVEMETSFEEHNRAAEGMQAELEAQIQAGLAAKADQDAEIAQLQQDRAAQASQVEQVMDSWTHHLADWAVGHAERLSWCAAGLLLLLCRALQQRSGLPANVCVHSQSLGLWRRTAAPSG